MKYGLIGRSLPHSFSAAIHAMLGNSEYELKEIRPQELDDFMKARDFLGINVTIPYKKDVIPYLDEISDEASMIGAVNTIVNKDGRLYGYNTDIDGFSLMCRRAGIVFADKKVVVFGSGGTSRTVSFAAKKAGCRSLTVISRTGENNYENLEKNSDAQVIINTTPCGMFPDTDKTPADLSVFTSVEALADVIYNPLSSRLVNDARDRGIKACGGLYMLIAQAVCADALFTGKEADMSQCDRIYKKLVHERTNIVLTGMSGTGKSTVGRQSAALLGREFYDTDEMIVKKCGITIPQIFSRYGENYFRRVESDIVKQLSLKNGIVISCGGGTILSQENYASLRTNGYIIFLKRDLADIELKGRPKTPDFDSMRELYELRKPFYETRSAVSVKNDGIPMQTALNIKKIFQGAEL